jgi:hypothetical protein
VACEAISAVFAGSTAEFEAYLAVIAPILVEVSVVERLADRGRRSAAFVLSRWLAGIGFSFRKRKGSPGGEPFRDLTGGKTFFPPIFRIPN